jgi:hypothetical protein
MGWSGWARSVMMSAQEASTGPRGTVALGRVWIAAWRVRRRLGRACGLGG